MAETKEALMAEEGQGKPVEKVEFARSQNGETVNFELEPKTIGLTKEQLEKYRNHPFWKPLRLALYAIFWLSWIAMFVAAIVLVVLSPKCAARSKPEWWQTKVSYQILTATFYDTDKDGVGDFKGISDKIDLLRKIGVTTIHPSPVISIHKDEYFNWYDVVDHLNVDERFGTEEDFQQLIDKTHSRDMKIVMDLPVSSVSLNHPWFKTKLAHRFIVIDQRSPAYNNNEKFYDFGNGTKYLGYPNKNNPVLNWNNFEVKMSIFEAVKKYLEMGVDGFHIDHISMMAVDANGNPDHDKAIVALKNLTASIKDFLTNHTELQDKKIALFSSLRDIEDLHAQAQETGDLHYVIDNSFTTLNNAKCGDSTANCVHDALDKAYQRYSANNYTPHWQFSNPESSRLSSRFDSDTAHLLNFMQLTLPGAISLYYGQELGMKDAKFNGNPTQRGVMQWSPKGEDHHGFLSESGIDQLFFGENEEGEGDDNYDTQYFRELSPLKVYRKLAKLRQRDEALVVGTTVRDKLVDDVILYGRYARDANNTVTGNAYLVALNFGNEEKTVDYDYQAVEVVPKSKDLAKAEIAVVTIGLDKYKSREKIDLTANKLVLPAKQGILVRI